MFGGVYLLCLYRYEFKILECEYLHRGNIFNVIEDITAEMTTQKLRFG
jgi:hypothetical protein